MRPHKSYDNAKIHAAFATPAAACASTRILGLSELVVMATWSRAKQIHHRVLTHAALKRYCSAVLWFVLKLIHTWLIHSSQVDTFICSNKMHCCSTKQHSAQQCIPVLRRHMCPAHTFHTYTVAGVLGHSNRRLGVMQVCSISS